MPIIALGRPKPRKRPSQCQKPTGVFGRLILWLMNKRHGQLTDWGLGHIAIRPEDTILDVGCGGGRTVAKLAAAASKGMVWGVDYSAEAVAFAQRTNRALVESGRVQIKEASVSALPLADDSVNVITAVETHFWWPDLAAGMREAFRVLKPGGRMAVIAEFYNGGRHAKHAAQLSAVVGLASLDVAQHRAMFTDAGFTNVQIDEELKRGWICIVGEKPR